MLPQRSGERVRAAARREHHDDREHEEQAPPAAPVRRSGRRARLVGLRWLVGLCRLVGLARLVRLGRRRHRVSRAERVVRGKAGRRVRPRLGRRGAHRLGGLPGGIGVLARRLRRLLLVPGGERVGRRRLAAGGPGRHVRAGHAPLGGLGELRAAAAAEACVVIVLPPATGAEAHYCPSNPVATRPTLDRPYLPGRSRVGRSSLAMSRSVPVPAASPAPCGPSAAACPAISPAARSRPSARSWPPGAVIARSLAATAGQAGSTRSGPLAYTCRNRQKAASPRPGSLAGRTSNRPTASYSVSRSPASPARCSAGVRPAWASAPAASVMSLTMPGSFTMDSAAPR